MISKEDALKDMDSNKIYEHGYCHIKLKLKCDDCPFNERYNNGQTCRDNIKQYVEKKKKLKEILK